MGRLKQGKDGGYVLLDALAALCIVLIGFSVFLGSVGVAGRMAARHLEGTFGLIEKRNAHDQERTVSYRAP
jgi:hypothetical protein